MEHGKHQKRVTRPRKKVLRPVAHILVSHCMLGVSTVGMAVSQCQPRHTCLLIYGIMRLL